MKPPRQLFVLAAAVTLGACAALTPDRPREHDARHRLDRGLSALEAGAHPEAFDDLAWVYSHCPARAAGSQALVALAALELDPRNPRARPDVGTELLAQVLQQPGAPRWARPLAETTFLTGLALGAPAPDGYDTRMADGPTTRTTAARTSDAAAADAEPVSGAESDFGQPVADATPAYNCGAVVAEEGWAPAPLPVLPGPSLAALLADAEAGRDSVTAERNALQNELATVRAELEATRAELERIRQTLKP